ncbi:dipeptidase [Thalassotalea piscium]|uniref:Microsomal dipeptidase-like Zn-dependent dipeptidase n=1 Tax=Thalassotalea piscium TaxID=1230533 RepID=A0A7X0NJI7_9GAMM|nr:dipeptidase [Thalassotalea piscium]MBB6544585.1 microsomal dipeptidase-like Zn-dependent dipeptidase [Thalassotalea piscium]
MNSKLTILAASLTLILGCNNANVANEEQQSVTQSESAEQLVKRAKAIHERVIVLDTHNDFSDANFVEDKNYTMRLKSQVNLPKMEEGGLDVSWLIVYTGQGELNEAGYAKAYASAMKKFESIHRLTEEIAPDQIELALTSDDVRRIIKSGKKVAMIGVENGYPIGEDISNVKKFYDLGARYMSLAHNGHSQLSDSNTGDKDQQWLHNGLSDLGREAIKEMNKWGIMIDISHPSKMANMEMMRLSKAPVIASHSSSRAMNNHSRNLDDEELLMLKKNGGVVQAVAFQSYLNSQKHDTFLNAAKEVYQQTADKLGLALFDRKLYSTLDEAGKNKMVNDWQTIKEQSQPAIDTLSKTVKQVDVADLVDHIDYMVKLIGVDHVGISSDFDGGGGVLGWNDAAETHNVTIELVKRGYSESDIEKIWSGNLLRVLDDVQRVAKEIQANKT